MIRDVLERIMSEYPVARDEPLANHPLAAWLRHEVPDVFKGIAADHPNLVWVASPGQGQWASAPWIAALDPLVTESAQDGYYPVYLFSRSCQRAYLSLNQGVTSVQKEFGPAAKSVLEKRALMIRHRLKSFMPRRFNVSPLDLQPQASQALLGFYEAGHIVGVLYPRKAVPKEVTLQEDLKAMLGLYAKAIALGGAQELDTTGLAVSEEGDHTSESSSLEEKRQRRLHSQIERNRTLARRAKEVHGYRCQVCGFDFGEEYGDLGLGYIEAHHLTPLADLPVGGTMQLSPERDFAVVCANCHRMIHRKGAPTPFSVFRHAYQGRKVPQTARQPHEEREIEWGGDTPEP